jgi:hypothetical protein
MFPFGFPALVLAQQVSADTVVLDPFCGRGTTNLAARVAGHPTVGIDSNPVAVAIAQAKLVQVSPDSIAQAARGILENSGDPTSMPEGDFWDLAFHPDVLRQLCTLREALLEDCQAVERIALRAIVLGALHGPRNKGVPAYFSNQAPRTFAPKPAYALRFWRERDMRPPRVDVAEIISRRASRYFGERLSAVPGAITLADSRDAATFAGMDANVGLVITSPPYYGMRTYVPDQWLRGWFLGGPTTVDYSTREQLGHASPEAFASELRDVWRNVARVALPDASMVIRFGAINDRKLDPRALLEHSIIGSGWVAIGAAPAGSAHLGKRQANHFTKRPTAALDEFDIVAKRSSS